MHQTRARIMLTVLALCWALIAVGLYGTRESETIFPWLWGWLFGLAALTTLWLAASLARTALATSLAFIVLALAGRVFSSVARALDDVEDPARVLALGAGYLALFVLAASLWVLVLGPLVSWREQMTRRGE